MSYLNQLVFSACLFFLVGTSFAEKPNALFDITPCPGSLSPKGAVPHDYVKHVFYCIKNNINTPQYLRIARFKSPAVKLLSNAPQPYALPECDEKRPLHYQDICVAHITISGPMLASLKKAAIGGPTVSALNPDGTTSSSRSTANTDNNIQATSDLSTTTPACNGSILVDQCNLVGITKATCGFYYTGFGQNCAWDDNASDEAGNPGICRATLPLCTPPEPTSAPTCSTTTSNLCENFTSASSCGIVSGTTVNPETLASGVVYFNQYFVPCAWTPGEASRTISIPSGCISAGPACVPQ